MTSLVAAFATRGARLADTISLDPVSDSIARGLLYDALVQALARGRPLRPHLRSRAHSLIVREIDPGRGDENAKRGRQALVLLEQAYGGKLTGTVPDLGWNYAEGVELRLDHHLDRWWCVFEPYTWVDVPRRDRSDGGQEVGGPGATATSDARAFDPTGGDPVGDWRRERWARRYNKTWADIIDAWAKLLAPQRQTTVRAVGLRDQAGVDAEFSVGATLPGVTRPTLATGNGAEDDRSVEPVSPARLLGAP